MRTEPGIVFERRFQNKLEELNRVSAEAKQFLAQHEIRQHAAYVADLAIEEIGTNILKYAYHDSATHEIRLRLEIVSGQLLLALEDDGRPFNPVAAPEPNVRLPIQERVPGGLGIHLVRKLVDQIVYRRRDRLNRLTLNIGL